MLGFLHVPVRVNFHLKKFKSGDGRCIEVTATKYESHKTISFIFINLMYATQCVIFQFMP